MTSLKLAAVITAAILAGGCASLPSSAPASTPSPSVTPVVATSAPPSPTPSPAAPAPAPAPPAPPATTASCYPLSDEGTCYEPGEYCRDDDHGMTGVAGDGETITCENNDGWRWEPS